MNDIKTNQKIFGWQFCSKGSMAKNTSWEETNVKWLADLVDYERLAIYCSESLVTWYPMGWRKDFWVYGCTGCTSIKIGNDGDWLFIMVKVDLDFCNGRRSIKG